MFELFYWYLYNINFFSLDYSWYTSDYFNKIEFLKYFKENLYFILIYFLIEIITLFIWNLFFYKNKEKDIFIYSYIFRFIPILSHIWSFLIWANSSIKRWLITLTKWYFLYIFITWLTINILIYFGNEVDNYNLFIKIIYNNIIFTTYFIWIIFIMIILKLKKLWKK